MSWLQGKKSIKKKCRMKINKDGLFVQYEAVVIGGSSGGMEVLRMILKSIPKDFVLPIIVVQHMHSSSDNYLAHSLNEIFEVTVKEVSEKEDIIPGNVYIAAPNYHLLIENDRTFSLAIFERVNFARPSIDVMFESAADVYGSRLVGVVLTGANYDGSLGLKKIKEKGGLTIVQDPATAEMDSMPREAIEKTDVDFILPPEQIGPALLKIGNGLIVKTGN